VLPSGLIHQIRVKVASTSLPPSASDSDIVEAKAQLGFRLDELYSRLLRDVANGGFGPEPGLYGVGPHGHADSLRGGLVDMRRLLAGPDNADLPPRAFPILDFGCGAWAALDAESGRVLTIAEEGVYEIEFDLAQWLDAWIKGAAVGDLAFDRARARRHVGTNPFTGEPMTIVSRGPARGTLILRTA
jgi:hypothetical protein